MNNSKENARISKKAIVVLNDLLVDTIEKISRECRELMVQDGNKRCKPNDVSTSIKLQFTGELRDLMNDHARKQTKKV